MKLNKYIRINNELVPVTEEFYITIIRWHVEIGILKKKMLKRER